MAVELTAPVLQTVAENGNILFTAINPRCGVRSISWREGSGIVDLSGATRQCRAQYIVEFTANIAVAESGTVGPISVALALGGEPLLASTAIATPAAIGDFWNVHVQALVDARCGCCEQVSVRNTSATAIDVQNASLIVERKA
ncbi:MAG: hypothetical protein IJ334_05955 [Clostridia bacterium]|nr:hypothetical protein [Clostridia bacterium]